MNDRKYIKYKIYFFPFFFLFYYYWIYFCWIKIENLCMLD